jgi:hypothetical protein
VGRAAHRRNDLAIAGAAAEIAGQTALDLVVCRVRLLIQQCARRHDHAGNAKAALHRAFVNEGLLHRIKPAGAFEPFNRDNLVPVGLAGQNQTGVHRAAVEQNRARAALAFATAFLGAGQAAVVAQHIKQTRAAGHVERDRAAVQCEANRHADGRLAGTRSGAPA